ncbi:MAG: GNAT family N-acetyltransferase [Sporichthyaceae bacterium]
MSEVQVRNAAERSRFEVVVGGEVAGFAEYTLRGGVVTFTHTEVGGAYEGQGLGSKLARFGLDFARERGLTVVPRCPYIAGWIEKHPEYKDLVG